MAFLDGVKGKIIDVDGEQITLLEDIPKGHKVAIKEIKKDKNKVIVLVSMFGRETPVELEFSQVQKLD